jgi:hypothetical protein
VPLWIEIWLAREREVSVAGLRPMRFMSIALSCELEEMRAE